MSFSLGRFSFAFVMLFALGQIAAAAEAPAKAVAVDPLARWQKNVTIRPVDPTGKRHTIHTYYIANPESPDGKRVLYYSSTALNGYVGELCMLDRATNKETVLVRDVNVEDAHRAACQQWISNGKRVAFHDVKDGKWTVSVVDVETLERRVLAEDRQLAFGQPTGEQLPIYGRHWNPGSHRDLEMVNASTGEIKTVLTADAVVKRYGEWTEKEFAGKPISIFFPVLSPDQKRVFFKIAAGNGGDNFMSKGASHRQGLVFYDLAEEKFLAMRQGWGHPGWHPDSRRIIEMGNILIDSRDGALTRIPNLPNLRGSHPSVSPDGTLMVTDGLADNIGGTPGEWGVVVGDIKGERHVVLHKFLNTRGARSWRHNDPHPMFSADGKRIYFNTNSTEWTQLFVAEAAD